MCDRGVERSWVSDSDGDVPWSVVPSTVLDQAVTGTVVSSTPIAATTAITIVIHGSKIGVAIVSLGDRSCSVFQ